MTRPTPTLPQPSPNLSGTLVESDQPVAVFSGVGRAGRCPERSRCRAPPGSDCEQHLLPRPPGGAGGPRRVSRKRLRGGTQSDPVQRRLRGARRGSRIVGGTAVAAVRTSLPRSLRLVHAPAGGSQDDLDSRQLHAESATQPVLVAQLLVSRQFVAGTPVGTLRWCCCPPSRST